MSCHICLSLSFVAPLNAAFQNFTQSNTLPVFRTESQYVTSMPIYHYAIVDLFTDRDRMLNSALNFAIGFFGLPLKGQYQQVITIEADGASLTASFLLNATS